MRTSFAHSDSLAFSILQEERSLCQMRAIRALHTRLLFILTRCSRLLITEQQHLFATEPRNARRPGGLYSGHSMTLGQPFTGTRHGV